MPLLKRFSPHVADDQRQWFCGLKFFLAARPGFEPGLGESKSPVLPLHHQAVRVSEGEDVAPGVPPVKAERPAFRLGRVGRPEDRMIGGPKTLSVHIREICG